MAQTIVDQSNEPVDVVAEEDLIEGEVVQDAEGMFYEVISIDGNKVSVKVVKVDEDWGE